MQHLLFYLFLPSIFLTQLRHQSTVSSARLNSTSIENSICLYVSSVFGYILSTKILILLAHWGHFCWVKVGPRIRVRSGSAKVRVTSWVMDYVNISPQNVGCVLVLGPP